MAARVLWLLALVMLLVPYLDTFWQTISRSGNRYLRHSRRLRITLGIVELVALSSAILLHRNSPSWTGWLGPAATAGALLGAVTALFGASVAAWAKVVLGRHFTAYLGVKEGHELVSTGPYRWIRHPIYTGLVLFILGTALAFDSLPFLGLVLVFGICFGIQTWSEERAFADHFGAEYEAYRRAVPGFLPRPRRRSSGIETGSRRSS